jgi:hypothetical protein
MKKLFIFFFALIAFSCAESDNKEKIKLTNVKQEYSIGEDLVINYEAPFKIKKVNSSIILENAEEIKVNNILHNSDITIKRLFEKQIKHFNRSPFSYIKFNFIDEKESDYVLTVPIEIKKSISIQEICATEDCNTVSGNVLENIPYSIKIKSYKMSPVKFEYSIITNDNIQTFNNEYDYPVSEDWIDGVVFPTIKNKNQSNVILLKIKAYEESGYEAVNYLPVKIIKPMQIVHKGIYELAEVYDPIPVSGCITGAIGNNVSYSESNTETKQQSVNIVLSKNFTNSNSINNSVSTNEGISIGETRDVSNSFSNSESTNFSETETNSNTDGTSNGFNYSTSDGESWSWSIGESQSSSNGNSNTIGGSGSLTVGVSGEGSLPFLAKASGKVETTVGVNASNTSSNSTTDSNNRGYTTSGNESSGNSWSSIDNSSNSKSLTGSYALTNTSSSVSSNSNGQNSTRVWNMSESEASGKIVTTGDSESISNTIVNSSSSTTTFSYSAYIPLGRTGIFYRQTSRWTKLSEIITYDLNGFPSHAGYISMNTWSWAPSLAIGETCREVSVPNMEPSYCYIPPCGE